MYSYNIIQWMFIFYFYCFFGWCFESTYVSIRKRRFVNRGFMRGPFLPLYGSGAVMMLLVSSPFQDNMVLVYIAGCIGATVLEYVTGVVMEALFKVRYWDYSDQPLNFQGHICLGSSLAWGLLTILMTEFIHWPVDKFVYAIPVPVLTGVTLLLTVYIVGDFALSFKAAMDLKDILMKMEAVKKELVHVQKRLDVIAAVADSELSARKEAIAETIEQAKEEWAEKLRIEEIKESIEEKLNALKNYNPSEYLDSMKEEIGELRFKYRLNLDLSERLSGIRDFYKRNMIRSNPTMSSRKFSISLEELKKAAELKSGKKSAKGKKKQAEEEKPLEVQEAVRKALQAKEEDKNCKNK